MIAPTWRISKRFFDFIIIDEYHRGANDESSWRAIMEYFSPAVHLLITVHQKEQ
ncbi:MAG: DEAD/DEAH box helicase family protein [Chitinophagaceae bacterium]|nr:DEAD/DEAH box helicase family protein [Chitinophagaceae bacterium]